LNSSYVEKFVFPFIIAGKGLGKDDILSAFETRIGNVQDEEFATATAQVEKIALLRLTSMLRGIQTLSCFSTYSMKRFSAAARPG
ncbi:2-oxo-4-hydroxy-4-carboxy-5-ureidoimidazoline decarboxylase, partial [Rhizobium ruizarguesonis]